MQEKIKNMCLSGVMTAIVYVFTAYFHIPSHTGYTHIGDAFIYLAACLLPLPYAIFVGAGGAILADCLTGFAIWAPGSAIIKAVTVLFFSEKTQAILSPRNTLALLPAAMLCTGGYYLYEAILTGQMVAPIAGIPGYLVQSILSSLLFLLVGWTLDKMNIKKHIHHGGQ